MSDTQAELSAAREQLDRDNLFASNSNAASYRAYERLRRAEVAAWKAGECCGRRGENGRCLSRGCEVERLMQTCDAGVGESGREAWCKLCEHSAEYLDAVSWLVNGETEAGAVLAGRLWALRFLEFMGVNDVNGNCSGGQNEEGARVCEHTERGQVDHDAAYPCGARAD